jgi:hypothetical protein
MLWTTTILRAERGWLSAPESARHRWATARPTDMAIIERNGGDHHGRSGSGPDGPSAKRQMTLTPGNSPAIGLGESKLGERPFDLSTGVASGRRISGRGRGSIPPGSRDLRLSNPKSCFHWLQPPEVAATQDLDPRFGGSAAVLGSQATVLIDMGLHRLWHDLSGPSRCEHGVAPLRASGSMMFASFPHGDAAQGQGALKHFCGALQPFS